MYRHSILTAMIKKLTPKSYEMFAGHSLETGMKIYAHLDNDDLRQELNEKVYHLEKITREETERIKELEEQILRLKAEQLIEMELMVESMETKNPKKLKEYIKQQRNLNPLKYPKQTALR